MMTMIVKDLIKLLLTFPLGNDVKIAGEDLDLFSVESRLLFHGNNIVVLSPPPSRIEDLPKKTESYNRLWVNEEDSFIIEGKQVRYGKYTLDGIEYNINDLGD